MQNRVKALISQMERARASGDWQTEQQAMKELNAWVSANPELAPAAKMEMERAGFEPETVAAATTPRPHTPGQPQAPLPVLGPPMQSQFNPLAGGSANPGNPAPALASPGPGREGLGTSYGAWGPGSSRRPPSPAQPDLYGGPGSEIDMGAKPTGKSASGQSIYAQQPGIEHLPDDWASLASSAGGVDPTTGSPVDFNEAMLGQALSNVPDNAYFKSATGATIGEVTPGFTKSDSENNPAWQYYLQGSNLRDTYAEDSMKDDFMAAEMIQRLLGNGPATGALNPVDQLYGTQQLMGQVSSPGKFLDPQALWDSMFSKVAQIDDPNLQMTYINGALAAMKPYMSSTDYMNLQSQVSRRAEDYMVKGVNQPTADKDFLSMLQGIR